jgi:hypothetical protein
MLDLERLLAILQDDDIFAANILRTAIETADSANADSLTRDQIVVVFLAKMIGETHRKLTQMAAASEGFLAAHHAQKESL